MQFCNLKQIKPIKLKVESGFTDGFKSTVLLFVGPHHLNLKTRIKNKLSLLYNSREFPGIIE